MNLLDLAVTISAKDEASSKIEGLSTKSVALGSAIGGTISGLVVSGVQQAAGAIVGFGQDAIETGKTFDQSMSQVAATMGVTTDDIQDLTAFAKEMGATTAFSANDAAGALNYMALAGYDANTSMEMLPNVLNLAAAGSMDLKAASDMVTDAQTALGLSLEDTNVLVDQMAQTSSKSNTSVQQLGDAILTVGGTAKNLSGGMTEMNTVLGVLADNGIKGSEAGTHLRNMILSLSAPTDVAAGALADLGVSATDMEGNLRPIPDIMHDLNLAMSDLSQEEKNQALTKIFNKTDLASVNALLSTATNNIGDISQALLDTGVSFQFFDDATVDAQTQAEGMASYISNALGVMQGDIDATAEKISGEFGMSFDDAKKLVQATADVAADARDRYDELADSIGDSAGAAEKMAQTQLDNLAGDMTLLESATEGVKIELAAGATPALRDMAQAGTAGLGEMAKQLQSGDLLGGFETLGQTVTTVATSFVQHLPEFVDAGMKMIVGFVKGFAEGLPQMIPAIVQSITSIVQVFYENYPLFINAAMELIKGLALGLVQAIPVLVQAIPQLITSLINAIVQNITMFIQGGIELFTALVEAIPPAIVAITEALPQIITAIVTALIEAIPQLIEAGIQLFMALVTATPQIIEAILPMVPQIIEGLVNGFIEGGAQIIEAFGQIFGELPGKAQEFLSQVIENVGNWITDMAGKAGEAGQQFVENVVKFVTELPGKIAEFCSNIISKVTEWASNMREKAQEAGKQFLENVVNFVKELPGKIAEFCSEIISKVAEWVSNMVEKAIEAGSQFLQSVSEGFGNVVNFFMELPGRIIGALGDFGSMLFNVGAQIIQGLINGITSMISGAISAVTNAVGGIVNAAKSFLGIHSPSRVFAEIGDFSMQGLAKGFEDGSDEAADTLEEALDEMSSNSLTVGVKGSGSGMYGQEKSFVFNVTINSDREAMDYGRKIGETLFETMKRMELSYL